jgi:hypothetical protein
MADDLGTKAARSAQARLIPAEALSVSGKPQLTWATTADRSQFDGLAF